MFLESLQGWILQYGYMAIFFLLMLGIIGLPIPDETLLTLSGYLILRGDLHPIPTFGAALAGTLCGITVSYVIGRTGGTYVLKRYGPYLHLPGEGIIGLQRWFKRIGKWSLLIGYFIPGVRHGIAIVAGTSRLDLPTFALFAYSGALLWTSGFILFGYEIGKDWRFWSERVHGGLVVVAVLVFLLVMGMVIWARWGVGGKGNKP